MASRRRQDSVFASIKGQGLFRSDDAGLSWQRSDGKQKLFAVTEHPLLPELYAQSVDGIYRSSDFGQKWLRLADLYGGAPVAPWPARE